MPTTGEFASSSNIDYILIRPCKSKTTAPHRNYSMMPTARESLPFVAWKFDKMMIMLKHSATNGDVGMFVQRNYWYSAIRPV